MGSDVRLKDLIGIMRPGDRLMIEDQTGRIIYRQAGYVFPLQWDQSRSQSGHAGASHGDLYKADPGQTSERDGR